MRPFVQLTVPEQAADRPLEDAEDTASALDAVRMLGVGHLLWKQ